MDIEKIQVWFESADDEHIQKERRKAQEMRKSQWWKNRRASNKCYYCEQSFPAKIDDGPPYSPCSRRIYNQLKSRSQLQKLQYPEKLLTRLNGSNTRSN